ncbi:hypothetical protein OY671_005165, partial [Metschnikowia pulcherrima]
KVDKGFISLDGELIGYRRKGSTSRELKEREILGQRTQIGFVFSGTPEGEERSRAFAGPGQDVIEERERTAEHETVPDDETPDHDTGDGRARG